jgi:iron(III) transport system ATP-binding protein
MNVTKKFGSVTAVDNLNLEINRGECFSMLGPSGCGKTTTLRMIAGFEDLDDGEIHVGDRMLSSRRQNYYLPPEKRGFGMFSRHLPSGRTYLFLKTLLSRCASES